MAKKKHPILAKKFFIGTAKTFFGNYYFSKKVKLINSGVLKNIQPPYVVVSNHAGFADVGGLAMLMYPHCANFITSETQIIKWPKLLWQFGILPKKQFTVDTNLVRDIKYVLSKNRPIAIFPEAKVSVDGRANIIKPAVAKLIKMLKVPLVTVRFDGNYLHRPRWATKSRFVPMQATVQLAVSKDDLATITAEEIHNKIVENLAVDDYAYQLENKIIVDVPDLCEGLEYVLYKCPHCNSEFAMTAKGNVLTCSKCNAQVTQNNLGQLVGGKFDKVTDWYDWQRNCVADLVSQKDFVIEDYFEVERLEKKNYVELGQYLMRFDSSGITIDMAEKLFFKAGTFYTLSFERDYIYLPTSQYVYRLRRLSNLGCTTKLNLCVEEQTKLLEENK